MIADSEYAVLQPLRSELAARVREGLLARGFTGEALNAVIAATRVPEPSSSEMAKLAAELRPETPLACLIRAFGLQIPTPEEAMRTQLGEAFFALCEEAGLWTRRGEAVVGSALVSVREDCFLLSDDEDLESGPLAMYWVMGMGVSSERVAHSVIERPYERLLDLCCGSGIQSFLAAGLAREIVAVDRNRRALNYGRFGAAMNGQAHIEFRESDCYAAVAGERFDAIVCNPPYVLSPGRQKYYRDGGISGDGFAQKVLTEAPAYLREGGYAFFVCDVAAMGGFASEERLRGWLAGLDCDVMAIKAKPVEAMKYAQQWARGDAEELARWRETFQELAIKSVTNWNVVMRRRPCGGENWFRTELLPGTVEGRFGAQVERRFLGQDWALLEAGAQWVSRLRLAPDARMERTARAEGRGWKTEAVKMTFAAGLVDSSLVDPRTVDFLLLFDGEATMEEILGQVAQAMGAPAERVREGWLRYVTQLAADGILEPVTA